MKAPKELSPYERWQVDNGYPNILFEDAGEDNPDDITPLFGGDSLMYERENGITHDSRFDGTNDLIDVL
jgi:hypothetical protein